jgi:urea transport system permease protein
MDPNEWAEMRKQIQTVIFLVLSLCMTSPLSADTQVLTEALESLKSRSFKTKAAAVERIAQSGDPAALLVLDALLAGRIYKQKSDSTIVIVEQDSTGDLIMRDAVAGTVLGKTEKSALKKIIINNSIRGALRIEIARLSLQAPTPAERRLAVKSLFGSLSTDTVGLLRKAFAEERDSDVLEALRIALALADLESQDTAGRLAAIDVLAGSMHSEVRNRLAEIAFHDTDEGLEPDAEVRKAAAVVIERIDSWRSFYGLVETTFFGLSLGFVLALAAIGLAITFGVMGVINMAHGELIMLGAYATYVVQQAMPNQLELSLFVAIPVAFATSALVGVLIERGVVRFLYGRPLETLLATFGVSLILQQTVRTIFSPLNRAVSTPDWMSGQLVINDALAFTNIRLCIIVFSILVFMALGALLRFTTLGLQIRAVSQNREMARAMGIRGGWIDATTFALGSGVAGLAGVALSQITNVGPNLGQSHIVDSFMVVVFGGVGNLWGTLVAGLSLGIANKFIEPFAGAVLAKIFVLIFIILFIQRHPRGLFPQQGRSAEV